jgi:hypothetical protein
MLAYFLEVQMLAHRHEDAIHEEEARGMAQAPAQAQPETL